MGRATELTYKHRSSCSCCKGSKVFHYPLKFTPATYYKQLVLPLRDSPRYKSHSHMRLGRKLAPIAVHILQIVAKYPNITRKQIVYKSGYRLRQTTVGSYLAFFKFAGMVSVQSTETPYRYSIAPKFRKQK